MRLPHRELSVEAAVGWVVSWAGCETDLSWECDCGEGLNELVDGCGEDAGNVLGVLGGTGGPSDEDGETADLVFGEGVVCERVGSARPPERDLEGPGLRDSRAIWGRGFRRSR